MSENERIANRIIAAFERRTDTEQSLDDVKWMFAKYGELCTQYINPTVKNLMPIVNRLFIVKVLEEEEEAASDAESIRSDALSDFLHDCDREDRIFGRH